MRDNLLSKPKLNLIGLIKRREEVTAKEAAEELERATSTMRQHLSNLESDGFVENRFQQQDVGRPKKLYYLTDRADVFFEDRHRQVLSKLIEFLQQRGAQEQLSEFFDEIGSEFAEEYERRTRDLSGEQRLAQLEGMLEKDGYLPTIGRTSDDRLCIEFHHCPFRTVVEHDRAPCRLERRMLSELVGGEIVQTCHMFRGDSACRFLVESGEGDEDNS